MSGREQERIVYDPVIRRVHWLSVVLALVTVMLAWGMIGAPRHGAGRVWGISLHASFGLVILMVMAFWLGWRLRHPAPPLRPVLRPFEAAVAKAAQWAIVVLFIAMPVSGYLSLAAAGVPVQFFGLFDLPLLAPHSNRLSQLAIALHLAGEFLIYGLVALHVAAALMHGFIRRDGILERMLPPPRR
ncbi:MAG TPA: cytochrome b [Stellaceae bacterium]|nr:cytochrome b [Stellaceae bacterium]